MYAWQLLTPQPVAVGPLTPVDIPIPPLGAEDLLIQVRACGVCHTDLHIVEGELALPRLPVVPGHQIVGTVAQVGAGVDRFALGARVGVAWLSWACGQCAYCREGRENLCDTGRFTGYHADGGYAQYQVTNARFAYPIPDQYPDAEAAPLLCAGVIGYRALRLANAAQARRLGVYGFGASAHIAVQIAQHWGLEVYVFTRSPQHRRLAADLGATWTGAADADPGVPMDTAIIFAPAGALVPLALARLGKGGTLTLAGIHMSPIPQFDYALIWEERKLQSVANATRQDAEELLTLAAHVPLRLEVERYPLDQINQVLVKLKQSAVQGAAVVVHPP